MKIALCISGYLRSFEQTFPSLQKHFLNFYPQTDIFIHTWNTYELKNSLILNENLINNLFKPKNIIIEQEKILPTIKEMDEKNYCNIRVVQSVLSMFYKIKAANDLKIAYENQNNFKYDYVIRFRSDLDLKENIILENLNLQQINIPKLGDFQGINDQFAISNSDNMNTYCSIYDKLGYYLQNGPYYLSMAPEMLLKYHLIKNKIHLNRFALDYDILRMNGHRINNEDHERSWGFLI